MRLEDMPTLEGEIERLKQQLAECRAREKVLRRRCEYFESVSTGFEIERINELAPLPPSDSTALDTMKKQWQREALVNIAVAVKEMGVFNYSIESIVEEIHNRAKELE